MRPKEWAKRNGFSPATVWKWCREGTMPVPTIKTEGGRYRAEAAVKAAESDA